MRNVQFSKPAPSWLPNLLSWVAVALGAFVLASACVTPDFKLPDGSDPCDNRVKDGDETDVDCGGQDCALRCQDERKCIDGTDCKNNSCVLGKCRLASCSDTEANQEETDIDCGGPCGATCKVNQRCEGDGDCETGSCKARRCVEASCTDGKTNNGETDEDCGGSACQGTCEVGQACKTAADCRQPDDATSGAAQCQEDEAGQLRCQLMCPVRQGDCDRLAANGCEANTDTDLSHCGGCNQPCDPPHTKTSSCDAGVCRIGECEEGFGNCESSEPGCETDFSSDPDHCGSCEIDCSDQNGTDTCEDGVCGIECREGFADCDAETNPGKNGCETNILTNTQNCGGCTTSGGSEHVCPSEPEEGIFAVCLEGECDQVDCSAYAGTAACDGDGICDDLVSTPDNCGACGVRCVVEHGEAGCRAEAGEYGCNIVACDENYKDCDGVSIDCEVDVRTDLNNCGGCAGDGGTDCGALVTDTGKHVKDAICAGGECEILACDAGYADCDLDLDNGCEASVTSTTRCGGCLPSDAALGNGEDCEAKFPDAESLSCAEGLTCRVACPEGFCPGSTGACDVALGSVGACRACSEVCAGPEGTLPVCNTTSGCQSAYPVQVVNQASGFNTASTGAPPLSVSINVGSGPGRALVILAEISHTPTLTFEGTPVTPIASLKVGEHTGFVAIGFINDAALGSPGTKTVTASAVWGGKVMTLLELNNVAQGAPRDTNVVAGTGCQGNVTQLTDVSLPGSLAVAALFVQRDADTPGTPVALTEVFDEYAPDQLTGINGYRTGLSANTTIGWNVAGNCWGYALATASFNPRLMTQ